MKKRHITVYFIFTLLIFLFVIPLYSQDEDEQNQRSTRMSSDIKQDNAHFLLSLRLSAKKQGEKGRDYFKGLDVSVIQSTDTADILVAKATTDQEGYANISIPKSSELIIDEDGFYLFEAIFEGNDSLESSSADFAIKPASLTMEFFEEDSVKMMKFTAFETLAGGEELPMSEWDVAVYSKGLFSLLKLGTAWLEDGEATFPFPTDLPGDTLGNLFITARIEDSDDHGIVETKGSKAWAPPKVINQSIHRGLGDTDAPLWMVYTLITLLSVVWIHYLYVIFTFWRIKQEGKKSN